MRDVTVHWNWESLDADTASAVRKAIVTGIDERQDGYESLAVRGNAECVDSAAAGLGASDTVVTIGMGGSARGGRALTQSLGLETHHVLNTLDPQRIETVLREVQLEDTVFHVSSQSGETRETVILFENIAQRLRNEGADITERTVVTTREGSPLQQYAEANDIQTLTNPRTVTGRYSMFWPVGLIPTEVLGGDTSEVVAGADRVVDQFKRDTKDDVLRAVGGLEDARRRGYQNILFVPYAGNFGAAIDWFVQLWSESLGEQDAPISEVMGSEGPAFQHARAEQILSGASETACIFVVFDEYGDHTLGKSMREAYEATRDAFIDADVPSITLHVEERTADALGELFMTLQLVTVAIGLRRGVNVFDNSYVENLKQRQEDISFTD